MLRIHSSLTPALLAAAALALAGCGGGSSQPTAHPGPSVAPSAVAPARVVTSVAGASTTAQAVADAGSLRQNANGVAPDLLALSPKAFDGPVRAYRAYSGREADAMAPIVTELTGDLRRGDRAAAKETWGRAYDRYLLLGAAYGALGDLDAAIDGNPGGLVGGVHDPHFSGLHRIEYGLWTGRPLAPLVPWSVKLQHDVAKLRHVVRTIPIPPLEYATRAHEILEDAQRDMLSNRDAPWSGEGVRALADSSAATHVVIGTLDSVLSGRGDALADSEGGLHDLDAELATIRRAHGGTWPTTYELTPTERETLDGRLGAALQNGLDELPGALEAQKTPVIPTIPVTATTTTKQKGTK